MSCPLRVESFLHRLEHMLEAYAVTCSLYTS